jgi:hypothetical protein
MIPAPAVACTGAAKDVASVMAAVIAKAIVRLRTVLSPDLQY